MGVKNDFFSPPSQDEIEVTLIGTGGGYGESIVLKINNDDWIIVDSCVNPETKRPLSIEYLEKIGVDYASKVKHIICTHWHDDHILGISKALELCTNAVFCMPCVNDTKKFVHYVSLDSSKLKKGSLASFVEFKNCLDIIDLRDNKTIRRLKSDLAIYSNQMSLSNNKKITNQLFSLSPSESVITNFDKEIATLLNDFGMSKKAVVEKSANENSSVIYFKYGEFSALLGADLEVTPKKNEGWKDIYNNSVLIKGKSIIYKIPHHGSENGYDQSIYNKLIDPNAISKLSTWNRSSKLPQQKMIDVYKSHTNNLYMTSTVNTSKKPKKRDKGTEKIIDLFSRSLTEVKFNEGIVRTRHSLIDEKNITVETHGTAFKI